MELQQVTHIDNVRLSDDGTRVVSHLRQGQDTRPVPSDNEL